MISKQVSIMQDQVDSTNNMQIAMIEKLVGQIEDNMKMTITKQDVNLIVNQGNDDIK